MSPLVQAFVPEFDPLNSIIGMMHLSSNVDVERQFSRSGVPCFASPRLSSSRTFDRLSGLEKRDDREEDEPRPVALRRGRSHAVAEVQILRESEGTVVA